MTKPAAIYARVSSDRQKENHTIASQVAALVEYAEKWGIRFTQVTFRGKISGFYAQLPHRSSRQDLLP